MRSSIFAVACGIFSSNMRTLSCDIWDPVPWPGIEPRTPALGTRSLSHWTNREVPMSMVLFGLFALCFRFQYKWDHMVFVFLCLFHIAWYPLDPSSCCCKWQDFILFLMTNILLYFYIYHSFFIHSSIDRYLGCFHILSYYEWYCNEHRSAHILVYIFFQIIDFVLIE